jgi:hypothetical protein
VSYGVHRLGGIDQQIQDDLLQLDSICGYYGEPGVKTSFDKNPSPLKIGALERQNLFDHPVGIERKPCAIIFLNIDRTASLVRYGAAGREKPGMIDLRSVRCISGADLPEETGP